MLIEMQDVVKSYRMGSEEIPVLHDINLSIKTNEYLAVMGPSGSGKSTLMNILGCLDTPSSGKYHFGDKDVKSLSDNQLSEIRNKHIGFVFQSFNLLPRVTALQNVELPLIYLGIPSSLRGKMARQVLEKVGLGDRMTHRPNELSGGQKQRVAIARALVTKPSLILADEPTGNLDSKTGTEIMGLFNTLYEQGNTIILVTHEEYIAAYATRIIRLCDGLIDNTVLPKKSLRTPFIY
ncbi:MAG: ABC transporter ATP-binding protein [Nitrospira sp.]|nr:ABC transporter ATP-binding protein [Candidatus Manganitrophaceae bacterium]HIL34723.1 ABC transporter ATP-binding protein [Candidatus Manganitrophaceae bacterium]